MRGSGKLQRNTDFTDRASMNMQLRIKRNNVNSRTSIIAAFLSNKSEINQYNINQMSIGGSWHTRRYYFEIANLTRYDDMWIEKTLACVHVAKKNYEPKGANDAK